MAVSSHGTTLKIGDGGTFITIAEVMDITGPGMRRDAVMLRSDDPNAYPAIVLERSEPDAISFEIGYTGAETQNRLRAAVESSERLSFELTFPLEPVEVQAFDGYVTEFEPTAPVEGLLRASVAITLASAIDYRSEA